MSTHFIYIPASSLIRQCPICDSDTRYRRLGYNGERGEGQYCYQCQRWIPTGLGLVKVEVNEDNIITGIGQKTIDKFRVIVANRMQRKWKSEMPEKKKLPKFPKLRVLTVEELGTISLLDQYVLANEQIEAYELFRDETVRELNKAKGECNEMIKKYPNDAVGKAEQLARLHLINQLLEALAS